MERGEVTGRRRRLRGRRDGLPVGVVGEAIHGGVDGSADRVDVPYPF